MLSNHRDRRFQDLKNLSAALDSKFEGPFGIRFGLDGILGFVPFVGDLITTGISVYIIAQAALLGCSTATLLRMAMNVMIENLFDLVPFVGNFFDIFWKSNNKNMALLEAHLLNPRAVTARSTLVLVLVCLLLLGFIIGVGYLSVSIFQKLLHFLTA